MTAVVARAYLIKPGLTPWSDAAGPKPATLPGVTIAVREGQPGRPAWANLVAAASTATPQLDTMSGPGATIFVPGKTKEHGVAFCFGSGRHLLRSGSWVAGFGMRASLNAASRSGDQSTNSLLWVAFSTVEEAPVSGTLRGSVPRGITQFSVDSAIDRIRGVRATNLDAKLGVGASLEGATSLAVEVQQATDLIPLAKRLRQLGTATDYTNQWAHLDGFLAVEDALQVDELNSELEGRLRVGQVDGVHLDPPAEVESFGQVWFGSRAEPDEFTLAAALDGWRSDIGHLLAKKVRFDDGPDAKSFRLRDLLTAQLDVGGDVFLLDQGDWQHVSPDRLLAVQTAVDAVTEWPGTLDPWAADVSEGTYLKGYAGQHGFLVLDSRNLRASGATVMEFCDLIDASGAFIHVKRHGTKGLSHLAAQVTGSATRWATEPAFRAALVSEVDRLSNADATWSALVGGSARQSQHPVVIAIGTPNKGPLSNVLSTLAMLHLHRAVHAVESRGFPVAYRLIPES